MSKLQPLGQYHLGIAHGYAAAERELIRETERAIRIAAHDELLLQAACTANGGQHDPVSERVYLRGWRRAYRDLVTQTAYLYQQATSTTDH